MKRTPNELKSEAFRLLQEITDNIEAARKNLIENDGLTPLEAEAKLNYSSAIQQRSRIRIMQSIENMEGFMKN